MNDKLPEDNRSSLQDAASERTESRRRFLINFAFFVLLLALSIVFVRYALPVLAPFVIAFLVTLILRPLVRLICNKGKINERAASLVIALLFYVLIVVILLVPVISIMHWVISNIGQIPNYFFQTVVPRFIETADKLQALLDRFSEESTIDIRDTLTSTLASVGTHLTNLSGKVASAALSVASGVPSILLNILIMIISTVFMLMDYDILKGFLRHQLPDRVVTNFRTMRDHLGKLLRKYVVSYAEIMLITFFEILIGLLILRVKNGWLIAMLVAVFDILPVVGSGFVLMPWAFISLVSGSVGRGLGLVVLWVIVTIIRNIIEPKIVGSTVGMHPLLTLMAMIVGNFVYGGIGILLLPVSLALCQSLNNEGIIHIYKHYDVPAKEDPGTKNKLFIWVNSLFDKGGEKFNRWKAENAARREAKRAEKAKQKGTKDEKKSQKSDDGWEGK